MDKIELFLSKTNGYGSGYGSGYGYGSGSDSGYGDGSGYGYGDGYGDGLPNKIDNMQVYRIDNIPTIITHVVGNIAKGFIVNVDLSLEPCYVAKHDNYFAHGKTKEQAIADVNAKAFSNLDVDEKINEFLKTFSLDKKYKGHEFYKWHNLLTISCDLGRKAFVRDNNLSLDADYSVQEFIDICRNAWGKEIIKQLENKIKGEK
ncbi:MAG: hypothetical protein GX625_18450 [Clostridiaceae bacterium]|nr:hypothetical protein [Clostridiaceae bacterium]